MQYLLTTLKSQVFPHFRVVFYQLIVVLGEFSYICKSVNLPSCDQEAQCITENKRTPT